MTDLGIQHFEEQYMFYNPTLFILVIYLDQKKLLMIVGKQHIKEWWMEVTLY
jgi:hypothetical protein